MFDTSRGEENGNLGKRRSNFIVELISSRRKLAQGGTDRYMTICPFHSVIASPIQSTPCGPFGRHWAFPFRASFQFCISQRFF